MNEKLNRLGKAKPMYLATLATMVLCAIFVLMDVLVVSISAFGQSYSEGGTLGETMVDDGSFLNIIFMLAALAAAANAAQGLFTNKPIAANQLTICTIVRAVLFVLLLISYFDNASDADKIGADCGFAFGGWMLIICTIGGIVTDILTKKALKEQN